MELKFYKIQEVNPDVNLEDKVKQICQILEACAEARYGKQTQSRLDSKITSVSCKYNTAGDEVLMSVFYNSEAACATVLLSRDEVGHWEVKTDLTVTIKLFEAAVYDAQKKV